MSGSGSANNSWTILTPEGTAGETLRPVTMGTEYHEKSQTSAPGPGDNNQPSNGAESAEGLPVVNYLVSKEKTAEISEDSSGDQPTSVPASVTNNPIPSSLDVSGNLNHGSDEVSQAGGLPEGPAQSSSDPDSYSDSYTHVTPSPGEPPRSLLSTETLGAAEFVQEEGMQHLQNGEELKQEGDEPDLYPRKSDLRKEAEVGEERTEEGEPELRKRRSLLASLEQIGRREEEEEVEEFHLPQREDESGFSVNKCILGALILLGLGTIFFSGIFMDLDEDSEYGVRDLKDTEVPGKQKWLNPEAPPPPIDAENSELLNKLAKENEHISVLQAQLQQAQKEELKVAQGQAAEGAKERLRWEAVEKENSRLKTEMASLPVLQQDNERMKKELESFPALQKELETLRSTVTELKLSSAGSPTTQASAKLATLPPPGQPEDSRQESAGSTERRTKNLRDDRKEKKKDLKRDRYDIGEHKEGKERKKAAWMEGEKKDHKDGGKRDWKREKHEQGMSDKERDREGRQKRHSEGEQQRKEKDLKKEKTSRDDEGKHWKEREGKREWIEKREKKEWNEDVNRKKAKHHKVNEGNQWRGKEENKNWNEGKDHGGRQKGQKEWKKLKEGFKESGKEQWEDKHWKEKGEKEWKDKNDKHQGKREKERGERKRWEDGKNHGKERSKEDDRNEYERKSQHQKHKEWKSKDKKWEQSNEEQWKERGGWNEKKHNEDRKKERLHSQKNKDVDKFKSDHGHKEEHQYGDQKPSHTHRKPSVGQPEYWAQQRERLQHSPKPQQCNSLDSCAEAERLLPVPLSEFEAILQTYLAKAEQAGVDNPKRQELQKLATEFFKDGIFVHDQMSFQDFVEDLGDILEDMVEGEENGEEDGAIEDEMEEFEREVIKKFSMPGAGEREERIKGEWRKESGQGRG